MNLHDILFASKIKDSGGSSGSGGADAANQFDAVLTRSIAEVNRNVESVGKYACYECTALTSVNLPLAKSVGDYAFRGCTALTSANLPLVKSIGQHACYGTALTSIDLPLAESVGQYAFSDCTALTSANLPLVKSIGTGAMSSCKALTSIDLPLATRVSDHIFNACLYLVRANLPSATTIGNNAFATCARLKAVVLRCQTVCTLSNATAFNYCYHILGTQSSSANPDSLKDGFFYVPYSLIEKYKVATNWTMYADSFRAIEDYTIDGTITGEMDWAKMGVEL